MQTPGAGDINVNAAINWINASASLTLEALNANFVNAPVTGAGAVTMQASTGNLTIAFAAGGLSGYTLTANGSALASNYTLAGGVDWVTITPLAVTVTATGTSRSYDGTRTASVELASSGILGGDNVSFSANSADFVTPNAGNGIPIW